MSETTRPEKLVYKNTQYFISASTFAQCPPDTGREVAFIGRSNAGKSSAINVLTEQVKLARTSKTPGRTQLLNFFQVCDGKYLVDLPGFGYAKVPIKIKQKWQTQLELYLQKRRALRGIVLLMDIRHPFKEYDNMMIDWASQADMPAHVLLTKADKLKSGASKAALLKVRKALDSTGGLISVQLFSSLKKDGVKELRAKLDQWLTT